jgi:PAS domain S-box-containing protein
MEAIIFWHPVYRLAGLIKLLTAVVSWATVASLVPTIPKALAMRSAEELEREIGARKQAEYALQRANADLETRVRERTAELAEANAALRYEREMLRITLASIGDAVLVTDTQGRVTFLNSVAQTLTGWNEEATGRPLEEVFRIINEQTRLPVETPVSQVMHEGKVVGLANHTILTSKDGTERPIDDSAALIREQNGPILGVVMVFRDITARRREEAERRKRVEQLADAKRQLQLVTDSMSAPVARCSRDLKYLWVSQPYADWIDRPLNEIIGSPIVDVIGRKAFEQLRPYFDQVLRGEVVRYEEQVHFQGIGPRWINVVYTPTLNERGAPDGWVAVVIDIDDRKRMEEAIRASEDQRSAELEAMTRLHALSGRLLACADLRTALDDVLNGAILTTRSDFGNIQLFNPEIKALEIVAQRNFQKDFLEYFRTVKVDEGSACAQAMQSGERIIIEDVQLDHTYERHRGVAAAAGYRAVQSTPLKSRSGSIIGMLSTHFRHRHRVSDRDQRLLDLYARHAADFVERLRSEEALRKQEEALKEADRRKDEFLATLAHELRNPLAPIRNGIELLRRSDGNTGLLEQARSMMGRQLDQMVRLIDDLFDISRISQGKVQVRKEQVELAALIRSAVEAARPLIDAQGHQLTITLPPKPVYLEADPTRLAQVISNLLNNAAKYTPSPQSLPLGGGEGRVRGGGGQIWLSAEVASRVTSARGLSDEIVISVRDTGIGIAAEHLPRLFEMFSQVTPALERSHGGLGIGLSLVRALVELHGGKVEAFSEGLGRGSEFIVRLPVANGLAGQAPEQGTNAGTVLIARPCRILVVDDNRDAADSLAMMLRMMGHESRTAYDGLEAVQAAATYRPDVVLLDIGLPKMNGYEAARHIRQQPWGKTMPLMALTGWGQEEDKRRALEAGFDHHLTKPVDTAALEKLLALINPVPHS